MGHPDQHTPDDHRSTERDDAPEPQQDQSLKEDPDPETQRELEKRAKTGSGVRTDEPDEDMTSEHGHTYMGRQMDDDLKSNPRPRDADEAAG